MAPLCILLLYSKGDFLQTILLYYYYEVCNLSLSLLLAQYNSWSQIIKELRFRIFLSSVSDAIS